MDHIFPQGGNIMITCSYIIIILYPLHLLYKSIHKWDIFLHFKFALPGIKLITFMLYVLVGCNKQGEEESEHRRINLSGIKCYYCCV